MYPYPGVPYSYSPGLAGYKAEDNPALPITTTNDSHLPDILTVSSAEMKHQFNDYLLYQPPAASSATISNDIQWVPLATFQWSTNGEADIPSTGDWADYKTEHGSDAAGMVSPSTQLNFTPWHKHPSWDRINVFPPLPWPPF